MYVNPFPGLMPFLLKKKINVSKVKSKYSLNIAINVPPWNASLAKTALIKLIKKRL